MSLIEPIIKKVVKKQLDKALERQLKLYCQTCGLLFFLGSVTKWFDNEEKRGSHALDYITLAYRHAWNNPEHEVVVEYSDKGVVPPTFSEKARQQKASDWRNANKPFESLYHGRKHGCVCSNCWQVYYGPNAWKGASKCCQSEKVLPLDFL